MIITCIILFCFLSTSYWFSKKINSEILGLWIIILLSQVLLSVELLGIFGILNKTSLLILGLLYLVLVLFIELPKLKQKRLKEILPKISHSDFIEFLPLLVLFLIVGFYYALTPIWEIDSVSYHLPITTHLVQSGSVFDVNNLGYVGANTYFPANHEALNGFLLILFGNLNLGFIINLLGLVLFFFALKDLINKHKFNGILAFICLLSTVSTPFLFEQVLHYQVDLFLFCLFGSAMCYFFRAILQNKNQDLIYFFLLFGLALGTKYNAVLQAFILIPLIIYAAFHFRDSLKKIWWYPFLTILTGGLWYIRNFIVTGNPIYPFGLNLGFINFEGHQTFARDMPGSSILENIEKTNFSDVMGKIFQNNLFDKTFGNTSLILFILAIFCLLFGIFYFLYKRMKSGRKEQIIKPILFVLLFYLYLIEIFVYFRSPYTFTLWQETIRYIAPLLALMPVIFVLTANISCMAAIVICIITLPIIAFNIISKSFITNPDFLSIISEKIGMISPFILLIFIMIFLIIFALLIFNKKTKNYYINIIYFLIISILITASQSYLSLADAQLDDKLLNTKITGYSLVLPHIQKLRDLPKNNDIIAVAGMTTYWLFEKEGFRPVYINIDGCKECKYPDYRNLEHSVREYPNEEKWKKLLIEENVKYLLVGSMTSRSAEKQLYERNWADSDPTMFKVLLKENEIALYEIINNNSLL